ncbi:uncharacterized protein LOC131850580 [Achroia grisella]|uniref:uncharacterized protein LOC131850580 n=1 Tax=Achroia grisella TaxID=688607 RepID=UPI0027D2E3F4|nr:uncharacterized protein LOC131850580 [Achroia grisella]
MDDILKAIKNVGEQLNKTDTKLSLKIDNLNEKLIEYKTELDDLKRKNENQETRIDQLERDIRLRNLVFFGIEEKERSYTELEDTILNVINDDMNIICTRDEVQYVRRIGKRGENKIRPINISLTTLGKKIQILKNKSKLVSTTIYVKEDFPEKILNERKRLQEDLRCELEKGNKAIIKYNKLIILPNKENTHDRVSTQNQSKKRTLDPSAYATSNNKSTEVMIHRMAKKHKATNVNRNITQYISCQSRKRQQATDSQDSDRDIET